MREISRKINLSQPSVINHLKVLEKEDFIIREKKGIYPTFRANRDNEIFKIYKKINIILKIKQTGLLDYIYDSCVPNSIILFGSASKGEDIESSDLDIFVESKEKKIDLKKFDKLFNREISLFFEENFSKLSKELKNNILNGVVLKGYIKVF
jgi:predicted nucleotidyltransferase